MFIVVVVGSGILMTMYFGNLETVPYTKRTHCILLSKALERQLGDVQFELTKALYKRKILPPEHPDSVRIRMILKEIIDALQIGLSKEQVWSDGCYTSAPATGFEGHTERESLKSLTDASADGKEESGWREEDEILDDSWVQQSRKKGHEKGSATSHLEGLNFEVLVVNDPLVNAGCGFGGKLVVFTGLLEHLKSDAEIATVIGHEVGHAVARHHAESMTRWLWVAILNLILCPFVTWNINKTMASLLLNLFLTLLFSQQRMEEMEADYIGMLLIAAAGYDPRVAPTFYEKMGKYDCPLDDNISTHPSGKKRAELLSQAKIMEEAFTIYKNARSGRSIEGFL
ncbi:hypothetical protein PIB30_021510 [Stylosanthes scabra]|uniref:Peptidase M48 domain-containing protein n=1 Tax=Stylosanthes scabra TaxID=79078 RepID=A0ABU6Q9C9_9FABA|nr:hypothetical protein [Stylosanthes scabra]